MSPKKLTQLGLVIGGVSVVSLPVMIILRPAWGLATWWPLIGLGLALGLFVVSFIWGATLAAQQRAEMVDKLNDCYAGVKEEAG